MDEYNKIICDSMEMLGNLTSCMFSMALIP